MKQVTPRSVRGWNISLAQLWGSGPKLTIECGECGVVFRKRVPVGVNHPSLGCDHCGAVNKIPLVWEGPVRE